MQIKAYWKRKITNICYVQPDTNTTAPKRSVIPTDYNIQILISLQMKFNKIYACS